MTPKGKHSWASPVFLQRPGVMLVCCAAPKWIVLVACIGWSQLLCMLLGPSSSDSDMLGWWVPQLHVQ